MSEPTSAAARESLVTTRIGQSSIDIEAYAVGLPNPPRKHLGILAIINRPGFHPAGPVISKCFEAFTSAQRDVEVQAGRPVVGRRIGHHGRRPIARPMVTAEPAAMVPAVRIMVRVPVVPVPMLEGARLRGRA